MDLQKGYTFSGASPHNVVTAEKLNTLLDGATILPSFVAGKAEHPAAAPADFTLLLHSGSGELRKVQVGNLLPLGQALTGARGLLATGEPGGQVAASARELLLRAADGRALLVRAFAAQASVHLFSGGSTAGGRDAGAGPLPGGAWWYFHAISDGVQHKLLFSLEPLAPLLPAGYLYSAPLGAARLRSSGEFPRFVQRGSEVALPPPTGAETSQAEENPYTGTPAVEFTKVAPGPARTLQPVDLSRCVPPGLTTRVRGIIGSTDSVVDYCYVLAPGGSTEISGEAAELLPGLQIISTTGLPFGTTLFGFGNASSFELPLRSAQQMSWACHSASGPKHSLRITGFSLAV